MKPEHAAELFVPDQPDDSNGTGGSAGAALNAVERAELAAESPRDRHEESRPPAERRASRRELLATLSRLERTLDEMRGGLDATVRERRHREFSPARLVGALLQVLVVGLELWALSDWFFGEFGQILIKIGFAGVLQLGALTALLLGREPERV